MVQGSKLNQADLLYLRSLHCFELPHTPLKAWKYSLPGVWLSSDALVRRLEASKQSLVTGD